MSQAPGGFLEPATSTAVRERPRVTLPDRGPFDFPAPYNTRGIRLTNASDTNGVDALWYVGYSYWPNINAHAGQHYLLVFLGIDRQRGGGGPSLWYVDKATEAVTFQGALFSPDHPLSWATGEGWYWSATDPLVLYCSDATHLYRLNVETHALETVVDVNAADSPLKGQNKMLWQWHSSHDGQTHSATIKEQTTYQIEGRLVYAERTGVWNAAYTLASLDECQIDKSGDWLLIKEQIDAAHGEDNRIVNLRDDVTRVILDEQGAAGHSDNGFGYMIAADNWNSFPGALRLWMFDEAETPQGLLCYSTPTWDAEMNHVSHCNARPGVPAAEQFVVGSGASRTAAPRNNEICGFRLDGSQQVLVIAPVMTDLDAPGGGRSDYDKLPKGNLDPSGEYFCWTSNAGGDRLDAFLVRVPSQLLYPAPPTPPMSTCVCPVCGAMLRLVSA